MEKGIGSLDNSDWDTYSCDMNSADEFDDDELETILRDRISEDNVEEDNPDLDLDDKDDILGEDEDPDVTNVDDITRIVLEKLKDSEMPLSKNCKNYTKLLRRLFANKEDAKLLTWHNSAKPNDGKFRHPADGLEWKHIDAKYPEFGKEPRNLRLALSHREMNPYGNLSSQHSTWPVLLAIYNLPPYVCMKRKYLMLSLLISGPKEPGNDLDVYLAPLVADLRTLWDEGVEVFDAYQNSVFNLKAMLLCTISDFPAYGNLCGHTVHGKEACLLCGEDVDSCYLKFSKKQAFLGYRRFLDEDHFYRRQQKPFNGKPEHRPCPKILSGHDVYERVKDIKITYGKKGSKLASRGYKKMSPFFERLPYWRELSIRHCLDVMHIEKNVCDNIINTLLNVPNKSKDNTAARKDMMDMKIRPELAPQEEGVRIYLPPAAHTLSKKEKIEFLSLLAVAIRSILPKKVRYAITRFCFFFNAICNKVIDSTELDELQNLIVTSLCQFEIYFPPSFFTIMVHLTVHLVREIKYLGPVYLRYQYPFERLMKVYKDYTSNRYRPEGCIAERAIIDEALSFCYTHLSNSELLGIPKNRHSEWMMDKGLRGHVRQGMAADKWHTAHTYVIHNKDEVQPYIEEHKGLLRKNHRNKTEMWIASEHNKTFRVWFKGRVIEDLQKYPDCISSRLKRLCFGPNTHASSYSGYAINGCTFYTREQDDKSTMQNSGVCVEAEAMHFSSSKDKNPVLSKMHYYGVIEEIWELDYTDLKYVD
ncbi:uncharacterized protein LOC141617979 [Silene latifolia]|uniref:uncharacterized protein LOC141617979 n=1 Tax=Silene latifolia TaxID=37657 RepID=UPI003D77FB1C